MAHEHSNDLINKPSTVPFDNHSLINSISLDIWLVLGFVLVTLLSVYTAPLDHTFVRFVLGMVMVLLLPGYALLIALFPGRSEMEHRQILVYSVVFSIIVVPMIGFILNFTPSGIRLDDMVISVTAFILLCSVVSILRRRNLPANERISGGLRLNSILSSYFPATDKPMDTILTIIIILSILAVAGTAAYYVILPTPGEQFTEFYILGMDGKATNYSTNFVLGDEKPIIVGITNHERRNMTYILAVTLSNETDHSTLHTDHILLADNKTWENVVSLKPDLIGDQIKMEFKLYKDGNTTSPYRDLYLWVNVTSPGQTPSLNTTAGNSTSAPLAQWSASLT